ncbi:MAG: acyl carrier protein [Acidobacteriota bacterium]
MNDLEKSIAAFIRDELLQDPDLELDAETDLLSLGTVSSLGAMRIVGFLEERHDVHVPPEDLTIDNFISVQAIGAYVERSRDPGDG